MRVLQSQLKRPLDRLAISARGHIAAASSRIGALGDVEVWEFPSGKQVFAPMVAQREVCGLAFAPSGEYLLAGTEKMLAVLSVASGEGESGLKLVRGFSRFAIPATGRELLLIECINRIERLSCWEFDDGLTMRSLWADRPYPFLGYRAPTLSSDGRTLAVIVLSERAEGGADRSISIRESATGTNCVDIRCESESSVEELLFSADGSLLLSRTIGRRVLKFDVESGEAKGALVHPGRAFVTGMAVHPRGALACSRSNGSICFWDLRKSEPTRILDWKLGKLVSVAFSPDGSIGAAGTEDGQVIVWDVDE